MNRKARANVTFKVNLKYPDRSTFAERFSQNISRTGIFVRAHDPLPVGSRVSFDYRLSDDSQVLRGSGIVRWVRTPAEAKEPNDPPGMGIEFVDVDQATELLIGQIVARFGEGARAPKRAPAPTPRPAPQASSPAPAAPTGSLDSEEAYALDALDAPPSAMLAAADSLAQAIAGEATPMDFSDLPQGGDQADPVSWFSVDLAGSVLTTDAGPVTGLDPVLPALPTWLDLTWPAPGARATARRLHLALARGADTTVTLLHNDAFLPLQQVVQAALQQALGEAAQTYGGVAAVIPDGLHAGAEGQLQQMLEALGFTQVSLVPNAVAMCRGAGVQLSATDLALCIRLGTAAVGVALVETAGLVRPAIWAPDLGLQGSGPLDTESKAEALALLTERLVLLCDTLRRDHAPKGRHVTHLILLGDEPPWPGLQDELQALLGLEPRLLHDVAPLLEAARQTSNLIETLAEART